MRDLPTNAEVMVRSRSAVRNMQNERQLHWGVQCAGHGPSGLRAKWTKWFCGRDDETLAGGELGARLGIPEGGCC